MYMLKVLLITQHIPRSSAPSSFVVSSLDRMQKVMRTKQNIELEEALLKEASYHNNKPHL
jgi:hypothetical protein